MKAPLMTITVYGAPAGQGNLKGTKHGKLRHANGAELLAWRGKVRQAAIDFTGAHEFVKPDVEDAKRLARCDECGKLRTSHAELLGPVRLEAVITVARPKSVTCRWPTTRSTSDWDHYARAIGDALTGVIYPDDSQVIDGRAIVSYPVIHPNALHIPGAVIKIWEVS